jgi:hypothetical protein
LGNVKEYSFKVSSQLEHAIKIYSSVAAIDIAGNHSDTVSSDGFVVDHYEGPPIITSISPSPGNIPFRNIGSFDLTLSEPINDVSISGTGKYTGNIDLTIDFPESNKIQLQVNQILASNDSIHFLITGLSDLAFNVAKDSSFIYLTNILGDYNLDGSVDVQDLSVFATKWSENDYDYELGPVSGTTPHFLIIPDQSFNLRDVMSFTRMWHWSRVSAVLSKIFVNSGEEPKFDLQNNVLTINLPENTQTGSIELSFNPGNISITGNIENANTYTIYLTEVDTLNGKISNVFAGLNGTISKSYFYRVNSKNKSESYITFDYLLYDQAADLIGMGTHTIEIIPTPEVFALHENYPNPFNPITTINYDLPKDSHVNLIIYDMMGREVIKLLDQIIPAGYHSVIWNTRNQFGEPVSAGIYFYQIQTKGFVKTRKMVLLK